MKKVLIIDDEIDFCLLLKAYLGKLRYEVFYSNSLADGVAQAKKINPSRQQFARRTRVGNGYAFPK